MCVKQASGRDTRRENAGCYESRRRTESRRVQRLRSASGKRDHAELAVEAVPGSVTPAVTALSYSHSSDKLRPRLPQDCHRRRRHSPVRRSPVPGLAPFGSPAPTHADASYSGAQALRHQSSTMSDDGMNIDDGMLTSLSGTSMPLTPPRAGGVVRRKGRGFQSAAGASRSAFSPDAYG